MANLDNIVLGLEIIQAAEPEYNYLSAEHDILYAPMVDLSQEDQDLLDTLGWFLSGDLEVWCVFV